MSLAEQQQPAEVIPIRGNLVTEIVPAHPSKIDLIWPIILPWLERSMEHGPKLYTTDDVLDLCKTNMSTLWIAIENDKPIGMTITGIEVYPQMQITSIRWAGGDLGAGRFWLHKMLEVLKGWAKHNGSSLLAGQGRKGWLRGYGFRDGGVTFEVDII